MTFDLLTPKGFLTALLLCGFATSQAQVKVLFDNTHAETSGTSADWTIDADAHDLNWGTTSAYTAASCSCTCSCSHSDPQQYPDPAQSTVISTTSESYWEGALSYWAIDLVKKGFEVETLPYTGTITYGNTSNPQDLSHYKVFIVPEPNSVFSTAEKNALMQFVEHGGGLFMISDHIGSDRNFDGWDSPQIWLDFTTTFHNPFGITVDTVEISPTITAVPNLPNDSLLHGPMGNVTGITYHQGTSWTLDPSVNSTATGVLYASGTSGNTGVLVAHARYQKGKVAALGDSSPLDDGTGNPASTLYSSYATDAGGSHRKLLVNTVIWLAATDSAAATNGINETDLQIGVKIYQSSGDQMKVIYPESYTADRTISIFNIAGQELAKTVATADQTSVSVSTDALASGVYFLKAGNAVRRFIK